jgi:2-dehydropantoate 2-reductase
VADARWHILGAGAIGSLFGSTLVRAGVDCTLLLRRADHGYRELQVEEGGRITATALACSAVTAGGTINRLLVTTKAHQALDALQDVHHRLSPDATVLLLMNGMGLAEDVSRQFPGARVYCGTTTEGAYRRSPQHIVHAGRGVTLVGSPEGRAAPDWFATWEAADLDCRWTGDIRSALWHKLAINCAINPLTAIHRCRNGKLIADPELHRTVHELCDEIVAVSRALGFTTTAADLHTTVEQVAAATAENRSSMLQDVTAGRPTEIDHITGYLVSQATLLGIAVPLNRALLEAVKHV